MTTWKLVIAFIRRRPFSWALHVVTLAIGLTVVLALVQVERAAQARLTRDLAGVDLVVGAKGNPLQLVLSAVLQADAPTGNIPLAEAEKIARSPLVKLAVPVSMGDSYRGARIVGTTPDYLRLYGGKLAGGRTWAGPMEAVVGSDVARRLNLRIGKTFIGSHGLIDSGQQHDHAPYKVVGVLAPTGSVADRLILVDLASVWAVHGESEPAADDHNHHHHDAEQAAALADRQMTALLIQYRSPMAAVTLPARVRATPDLQAAAPPVEMARLLSLLGPGLSLLRALGAVLLGLAAAGFLIGLIGAVGQRRRDIALLRALGMAPGRVFLLLTTEALLLGLAGGVLGVTGARLLVFLGAGLAAPSLGGAGLAQPPMGAAELLTIMAAVGLALAAAAAPAWIASRSDPAQNLSGAQA
jgi:putative ABC transport system permease protein